MARWTLLEESTTRKLLFLSLDLLLNFFFAFSRLLLYSLLPLLLLLMLFWLGYYCIIALCQSRELVKYWYFINWCRVAISNDKSNYWVPSVFVFLFYSLSTSQPPGCAPYGLFALGPKFLKLTPVCPRLCGMTISETVGQIYSIQNFMESYRPVVVQRHSNRIYPVQSSMECSKPVVVLHHGLMSLTMDFQGQMLIKNRITWMEGPIDMGQKRCESIGSGTHFMALNFDLIYDLGF